MKFKILLITTFLLFGAHATHAQIFGWHGSVTFTNGTNNFIVNFSGATYWDCENQRGIAKAFYSPPTYSVVSETNCVSLFVNPRVFHIPELEKLRWPKPWPWPGPGPVCLSCPYLRAEIIEHIYPVDYERVYKLVDEYRIDEYNMALDKLNAQYDMESFGKEMFLLEQEINQQGGH